MSSGRGVAVGPGGVLVVGGAVLEAAVQDADPSVTKGPEGFVMLVGGGAALVVEARAPGLVLREQKAHWSIASYRRLLRM